MLRRNLLITVASNHTDENVLSENAAQFGVFSSSQGPRKETEHLFLFCFVAGRVVQEGRKQ